MRDVVIYNKQEVIYIRIVTEIYTGESEDGTCIQNGNDRRCRFG